MLKNTASFFMFIMSGSAPSVSQRLTACGETFNACATSFCFKPLSSRSSLIFFPNNLLLRNKVYYKFINFYQAMLDKQALLVL